MDPQLLAFIAVAEEQSFTRAADRLHISQPAVSQHVQNLEQRLDVKLLDRTTRQVRLNRAGEVVYRHAKDILNLYQQMQRLVEDLRDEASGPLTIGASFTFGEYVLPHLIAGFRTLYPKVHPVIVIENTQAVVRSIAEGDCDIGVIEGHAVDKTGVVVEPLAEDDVIVVAASRHPLSGQSSVSVDELSEETWIIREPGSGTREFTERLFTHCGIRPQQTVVYSSTQVIKESVEAGLGLTVLSRWAVHKELQWGLLRQLPVTGTPVRRAFSVVRRASDFHPKATTLFRTYLLGQSRQIDDHLRTVGATPGSPGR
ncbi:MAG: LysR family transcriptional regulator [Alicyclobacillus sp.]|nr:LysR family transcriptional regulator [Alicyclobacillus sp.]